MLFNLYCFSKLLAVFLYFKLSSSQNKTISFTTIVGRQRVNYARDYTQPSTWANASAIQNEALRNSKLIQREKRCGIYRQSPFRRTILKAIVGVIDLNNVEASGGVFLDKVIKHENYSVGNENEQINDIALLHTSKPIDLSISQINAICLPKKGEKSYLKADLTGWGQTKQNGFANVLRTTVVYPFPDSECRRFYKRKFHANEMICAGLRNGNRDACHGDYGGPLTQVKRDVSYLIGIVSFGIDCSQRAYPLVYTRVSNYVDWIYEHIA
ncbi:Serine proteinase stubble-like protein [Dinothrombium tinctorium]|uniref:Serine proteinase stubble-like protein n=1 Tax=Dinothrombium tinctorium TaxID=1965070 RepID=A0A443RIG2_9ACAR|nr:Serine proteinase stubble-like protein [Dinothrombium tinctorium]RWS12673.1 Serine proteinase stubble-like protein [Dinothrombium tinctorium]RWS15038.1 Serine proteinase stubble-like protein [Dinothrombium tinctorium]